MVTVGAILVHAAYPLILPLLLGNFVVAGGGWLRFASASRAGALTLLALYMGAAALANRVVASMRAAHLEDEDAELTHVRVWRNEGVGGGSVAAAPQPPHISSGCCTGGVCVLPPRGATATAPASSSSPDAAARAAAAALVAQARTALLGPGAAAGGAAFALRAPSLPQPAGPAPPDALAEELQRLCAAVGVEWEGWEGGDGIGRGSVTGADLLAKAAAVAGALGVK